MDREPVQRLSDTGRVRAQPPPHRPHFPLGAERVYHYIICRDDLPRGFLASQIVHAAGETSPGNLQEGTHAVVLAVTGIRDLLDVRDALVAAEIPHKLICEPDAPYNGAPTCIGLTPATDRRKIRKVLGRLPLLR